MSLLNLLLINGYFIEFKQVERIAAIFSEFELFKRIAVIFLSLNKSKNN